MSLPPPRKTVGDLFGFVNTTNKATSDGFAHEVTASKEEWLTPKWILDDLGEFDLDPCAPLNPPWVVAEKTLTIFDNGLIRPWNGRTFTNPPYGDEMPRWMAKQSTHLGGGISLVFCRTETKAFFPHIWERAAGFLFIKGRVAFYEFVCAKCGQGMSKHKDAKKIGHVYQPSDNVIEGESSGAPSMLIAWSDFDNDILANIGANGFSNGRAGKFLMNEQEKGE